MFNVPYGAGVTVYSREEFVRVVGPFRYYEFVSEVLIIADRSIEVDIIELALNSASIGFLSVLTKQVFPYRAGTSFLVKFQSRELALDFSRLGGLVSAGVSLRVDRKFMYLDGALYSLSMTSKGRCFEPNTNASIMIPGFPPGYVRPVRVFRLGGVVFAAMPNEPKRHALIFPLPGDFEHHFSEAARNLVVWNVFNDQVRPVDGKKSLLLQHRNGEIVASLMDRFSVSQWSDRGVTVSDLIPLATDFGIDHHKLRVMFRARKDHICWRSNVDPLKVEWIKTSNILLVVPGCHREGAHSGCLVSDLMGDCRRRESGKLIIAAPMDWIRSFLALLAHNNITSTYTLEGGEYVITYARCSM